MRTLYLLRHAKSSWDNVGLADHDRPLNGRGRRAAELMASHLRQTGVRPALVLCSSAQRTRETLEAIRPSFGQDVAVSIEDGLYGAEISYLVTRLREAPPEAASVMVIAHNPGLQELAVRLAGDGDDGTLARLREKYPTGALATLDLGIESWAALAPGQGYLVSLVVPKDLG